jgi:nucleotide-binding universal stress UspA family protein
LIKQILVPTDGSDWSLRAAKHAVRLIQLGNNVDVTVFTVDNIPRRLAKRKFFWIIPERGRPDDSDRVEDPYTESRARILARTKAVFDEAGFPVRTDHGRGNPAEEIVRYANDHGIDLIVMGHRGAGGLQGLLMGSVSHKVIQLASCPVILVK